MAVASGAGAAAVACAKLIETLGVPFHGALGVRASTINEEMKLAAAHALADLARQSVPAEVMSAYGDNHRPESVKVRRAVELMNERHPDLRFDGEMPADTAIKPGQFDQPVPDCMVMGEANVLIFPDMQSGNIAFKLVGHLGQREVIGPLLYGLKQL